MPGLVAIAGYVLFDGDRPRQQMSMPKGIDLRYHQKLVALHMYDTSK